MRVPNPGVDCLKLMTIFEKYCQDSKNTSVVVFKMGIYSKVKRGSTINGPSTSQKKITQIEMGSTFFCVCFYLTLIGHSYSSLREGI